jgi:bacterioferritin-associated ferredoxin
LCHRVSDRDIAAHVRSGCESFAALQDSLRIATSCGRCRECALATFESHQEHRAHCSGCHACEGMGAAVQFA